VNRRRRSDELTAAGLAWASYAHRPLRIPYSSGGDDGGNGPTTTMIVFRRIDSARRANTSLSAGFAGSPVDTEIT